MGLEIAQDLKELHIDEAQVLVPCGGGGLTSGIALALEADLPGAQVRPVEPEGFDDVARSLKSGQIERNSQMSGNICDAIITPAPGDLTFPLLHRLCGPGLTVTEEQALGAVAQAFLRLKLTAEPGGAVALAAALDASAPISGDTIVAVISGGNIDAPMFQRALETLS